MKAAELRIGNITKRIKTGEVFTVIAIDISSVAHGMLALEGLPLTEEWLLKFGFEKKSEGKFEHNVNPLIIYKNERMGFYYGEAIGISHNYVHQLQNLYFALTGEELTIKA